MVWKRACGALLCTVLATTFGKVAGDVHIVFSTECGKWFDWQSLGLYYTALRAGHTGPFTRLMACDDPKAPGKDVIPDTFVHKNYAVHPRTGDAYGGYNKAAAYGIWLNHTTPQADYVAILDSDMTIRHPITVSNTGVAKGKPVSAYYGYLKGVHPSINLPVKKGLRKHHNAQRVGGFSILHRDDLWEITKLWLPITEEMREDPGNWANVGDAFNDEGRKGAPWIAEMYGYCFAAAEAGVEFQITLGLMLYPGYTPPAPEPWPLVMHYGLTFSVAGTTRTWAFEKKWFLHENILTCPPNVFQRPPTMAELPDPPDCLSRRTKELALHVGWGLHNATRQWGKEACKLSPEDLPDPPRENYECYEQQNPRVYKCELAHVSNHEPLCRDMPSKPCCNWAKTGECASNPNWMLHNCPLSCGRCPTEPKGCLEGVEKARIEESIRFEITYLDSNDVSLYSSLSSCSSPSATRKEHHSITAVRARRSSGSRKRGDGGTGIPAGTYALLLLLAFGALLAIPLRNALVASSRRRGLKRRPAIRPPTTAPGIGAVVAT